MRNLTPTLRILAASVIVFGSVGMYFIWNKILYSGDTIQEQTGTVTAPVNKDTTDNGNKNIPIISDIAEPTSTDPTSREKIVPSDPTPETIIPPTPNAITCSEIREATFKKCQADCPAEADIEIYHNCTAGCESTSNLLNKTDCINVCISAWSKAKSDRSDCISGCLKDYYATDCP